MKGYCSNRLILKEYVIQSIAPVSVLFTIIHNSKHFYFGNLGFQKSSAFIRECNNSSIEYKVRQLPEHFGLFILLNQEPKKGTIYYTAVVIDPYYQRGVGLLLYNENSEHCVWTQGILRCFEKVLSYQKVKFNGKS